MPPKSIAVPANPSARRGGRQVSAHETDDGDEVGLSALPARPPRATVPQPVHHYRVGERLRMGNGGYSLARTASTCKVVSLLPYEGRGPLLYRVRSESEAFERVVSEADLSRG